MSARQIVAVRGRRVWDSRGRPTVEAEVTLADGSLGRGIAPAGASRGRHEAIDLRDGGSALGGFDVGQAVAHVNGALADAVRGLDAGDQETVDAALCAADGTPNKARLGGNAVIAVSLAVLQAAATTEKLPLWRYLAGDADVALPLPEIQIFGGGAHAARRVDIQDFMVMPLGAQSFDEAMVITAEVYRAAGKLMADAGKLAGVADEGGFWPAFESNEQALDMLTRAIETAGYRPGEGAAISLDIAASEFHDGQHYVLGLERRRLTTPEMIEMLQGWLGRYPIVSIEDPVAETDAEGMRAFTQAVRGRCQVIGDDYLVSNAARTSAAIAGGDCTAVLLKPNQAGTVSETAATMRVAQAAGWGRIVSARSGETEDVAIAHLSTGWNAGQLKVGSFARSERMAKWNEVLRIEEAMGSRACFWGRAALAMG
ncbi:phosphopyruvate hydratase [Ferrovibrio sp.]|uniref:phosphopyruvate hydratase n=1 Tax=Ferrovibrio sp. TaxID=1917215 RepID=UPI003D13EAE0